MEQEIIDLIYAYAEKASGGQPNKRVLERIKQNSASFKRLVEGCGYIMKPSINEEGACVVEFSSSEGKVYTTYTFLGVLDGAQK